MSVYVYICLSVPFPCDSPRGVKEVPGEQSHLPPWHQYPEKILRLTIGHQFHQEITGGPIQSSALQSPDRVQDSEEQNYEEVHLQSEISLQYPDENFIFFFIKILLVACNILMKEKYWCYYSHRSRHSLSHVCGIFI